MVSEAQWAPRQVRLNIMATLRMAPLVHLDQAVLRAGPCHGALEQLSEDKECQVGSRCEESQPAMPAQQNQEQQYAVDDHPSMAHEIQNAVCRREPRCTG